MNISRFQIELLRLVVTALLVGITTWQATTDPLSVAIKVLLVVQALLAAADNAPGNVT
ncbi:MAG: hypothetical protein LBB58_07200 [Cellulomonadaceae bacterium]|jgi:hypothetical protein|nr:hypothetical protein [Cellulomonadaceae bacterium]